MVEWLKMTGIGWGGGGDWISCDFREFLAELLWNLLFLDLLSNYTFKISFFYESKQKFRIIAY